VGYHWDLGDEKKMQRTFGMGRKKLFTHFVDVRGQAGKLGWEAEMKAIGLKGLAKLILGYQPPKSKEAGPLLSAPLQLHILQPSKRPCSSYYRHCSNNYRHS
jgi:hypothetical protein